MRLSSVTCCTISALLGSGVAAQANEGINEYQPKDLDLDQQPDLSQSHTAEKYQVAAPVVPTEVSRIVPPETNLTVSSESLSRRDLSVEESATPIAAIAPSESRFVEELPQVLNHQPNGKSDSFISEFEWAVKQDETTLEEVTELAATPSELEEKSAVLAKEDRAEIAEPLARFNHKAVLEFIVPTNAEESKPVAIAEPSSPATSNIALSEAPESVVEEAVFSESEEPLVLEFELLNPEVAQSFQVIESEESVSDLDEETTAAIQQLEAEIAEEVSFEADSDYLISQSASGGLECKPCTPVEPLVLLEVNQGVSPALSISIPTGFGADQNTFFISSTYQSHTRVVPINPTPATMKVLLSIQAWVLV